MSESTPLRMSAYYYSFEPTGAPSIDRVLSAVACAGKAFHSTDEWSSVCEAYMSETKGNSCVEWIQNAAKEAATERAALVAVFDEMRAALELTEEALDMFVIAARMGGADEDDGDNHALEVARAALARAAAVRGGR